MWFEMTGPRPMQPLLFLLLGDGVGSGACCNHGCRSQRKVRFVRCVTFIGFAVAAAAALLVVVAAAVVSTTILVAAAAAVVVLLTRGGGGGGAASAAG